MDDGSSMDAEAVEADPGGGDCGDDNSAAVGGGGRADVG